MFNNWREYQVTHGLEGTKFILMMMMMLMRMLGVTYSMGMRMMILIIRRGMMKCKIIEIIVVVGVASCRITGQLLTGC